MTRKEIQIVNDRLKIRKATVSNRLHSQSIPDKDLNTFYQLLNIADMIVQFATKHLIRDNKLRPIGWRVWLYVPVVKFIFKIVKEIKKAI